MVYRKNKTKSKLKNKYISYFNIALSFMNSIDY